MKNYTIKKTSAPGIFTLVCENNEPVADIRGENNAILFSHLPDLLETLDNFVGGFSGTWTEAVELQEKLKPYRK